MYVGQINYSLPRLFFFGSSEKIDNPKLPICLSSAVRIIREFIIKSVTFGLRRRL